MSSKIMGMVWDCDLDHAQQLVLLAMADHADHDGNNVYPSIGRLAWKTGYSSRQVQRIINQLIGLHAVECQTRRGTKTNTPHHYRITLDNIPRKKPFEPKVRQIVTPDKMSPGGDIAMSGEGCHSNVILTINDPSTKLNTVASPPLPPPPIEIPIPTPSQSVAPLPRQPSVKLTPVRAKAPIPSKSGNGTKPLTSAAAKTADEKKKRAESPESVFFRAIDHEFFFDAGYSNSAVWGILNGRSKQGVAGIIFDECERQKTTRDKLDFRALAAMVPKFRAWYDQQNGKKLSLRNPENFCNWWNGWRNTTNRVDCPPKLFYDEHCPNHCDHGRVYTFDDKGMVVDAVDCICVIRIRDERKGIKY